MVKKLIKSSLFKSAGIYGGTNIINAAIPFLMMPILTRALNPSDYGVVAMFSVLLSFTAPFIGVSANAAIGRQYFNKDQVDLKVYIVNCFLILFVSTFVVAVVFLVFAGPIAKLSEFPKTWIWYVILTSFCTFISSITTTLWQVQSKSIPYGVFQISNTFINVLFSLAFVLLLKWSWQGRILAQVFTSIIFAVISIYILYRNKWFKFEYNKQYFNNALQFGMPLIPHTLGAVIMTMSDRVFITKMVGLNATGLYAVGYALGNIIGFVENSFNLAYIPWLYDKLNYVDYQFKRKIVKFTYLYFGIIISLALIMSFIAPYFLSFFVGEKFKGATIFVFWIAMSFAFSGMYKMVVNYIFYTQKTGYLAWITFSSAAVNLPLNYFLIKRYGAVGSAMATAFVSIFFFVLTWILSNKVYKMPWLLFKRVPVA
ncbi:lipopolysaccharide biosynthesis protein [Mucilaginibacter ginkgonis]|uniref:Oligosaccharide flippase family protein n=1 Tax=Mucilaginibacter ginkgonis TaxID=2682091 RepID=A0A6I4IP19_9SPHI|nr:oligosaccharide flippase family protein [Mucilaginibacter ginkgonis]QQL50843.1 oligosaccharide flippase family protein [Mucilaginibacter ginkgonis]